VAAVEEEVVEQGLEIRKVERVSLDLHQSTGSKADLSAYSSDSDSLLREDTKSSDAKPSGAYGGAELKEAHQLATKTMPPAELLQLLRQFPFEPKDEHRKRWGDLDHTLEILKSKGFIKRKRGRWMLTDKGQSLLGVFARHLPELESRLRRFLRHFPLSGSHSHARISTKPGIGWKRLREKKEVAPYTPEGRLNLAATVARAGCRWVGGHIPPGTIGQSDLLYSKPLERRTFSILLVVDCSASMAGDRLRAARMLAQHLVLATRGKVAVIAFQEDEVLVPPMFTSSLAKIQAQLLALKATGLTPMAKALAETHTFLMQRRVQKPLVVLITDGIPTVPLKGNDASSDALEQAEKLKGLLSQFVCIGLNPNQTFMEELCRRSGGQLYIVKELEPGVLAKVVHQELRRRRVVSRNNCNK
jgi:magnesium chelatase subunit D